jgi:3-hydroxy-9,10-secoandrosta-1,3,5(10)-triene-9,17-dione monooxygenase reductase component
MQPGQFTEVLRRVPKAVAVVTVGRGGAENGFTVSWATPVSFDPPQYLIAVDRLHYSVSILRSTRNFTINFLREGQERISAHFAAQSMLGEDKLEPLATREATTGSAVLSDSLAWVDCELAAVHEAGDHVLFVGRVVEAGVHAEGRPLMTHAGVGYRKSGPRG